MASGNHGKPPPKGGGPDDALTKSTKWLTWLKVGGGVIIGIFLAGFAVSQFLGGFSRTEDVRRETDAYHARHTSQHGALDVRLRGIEEQVTAIRIDQVRAEERAALTNARIELLLERTERTNGATRVSSLAREEALQDAIRTQEHRVERVEQASDLRGVIQAAEPPRPDGN